MISVSLLLSLFEVLFLLDYGGHKKCQLKCLSDKEAGVVHRSLGAACSDHEYTPLQDPNNRNARWNSL